MLLVTPRNKTLEAALSTERANRFAEVEKLSPDFLKKPEFKRQSQTENYDLIIFDQCIPESIPQANTLFVGRVPPLESWLQQASAEPLVGPQIIDWDRSHPLLNLIELGNVLIYSSYIVKPPAGGRVLVDSTDGPLMAIAPRDRFEDVVMGLEIVGRNDDGEYSYNTNWPRKLSFPSFWLNVLEYFTQAERATQSAQPGSVVELRVDSLADRLEVVLPDGTSREVAPEQPGRLVFHESDQLGTYEVLDGGKVVKRFAVNLFDREESDIALEVRQNDEDGVKVVDSIEIGFVDVAAQSPGMPVRKELWKPLLVLALVVLVLEWYIYNRRIYV